MSSSDKPLGLKGLSRGPEPAFPARALRQGTQRKTPWRGKGTLSPSKRTLVNNLSISRWVLANKEKLEVLSKGADTGRCLGLREGKRQGRMWGKPPRRASWCPETAPVPPLHFYCL